MKLMILMFCLCGGIQCETFSEEVIERYIAVGQMDNITDAIKHSIKKNVTNSIMNFSTKCFPDFGCYYNGPPFYDPVERPIFHLPDDNPGEKINYLLFTPQNQFNNYTLQLTRESLDNSPFNASEKTAVYIHGWKNLVSLELLRLRDALVGIRRYNFFVVEWMDYAPKTFEQAAVNGRVVGTAGAKLIKFLVNNTNLTPADIHAMGYSVGAQIASYTGKETPGLGRITAMDPAGGRYFLTKNLEVRLDPGDALFVDVIHTNYGKNFGDGVADGMCLGHQDFYPNGGQRQPRCQHHDQKMLEKIQRDPLFVLFPYACDHARSRILFTESVISQNCTFIGTECDSYDNWKKGKCPPSTHPVAVMGIDARPIPGLPHPSKFYLDTNIDRPFCIPSVY